MGSSWALTLQPQKRRRLENGATVSLANPTHVAQEAPTVPISSSLRHKLPNNHSGITSNGLSVNPSQQVGFVMSSGLIHATPTTCSTDPSGINTSRMQQSMQQSLVDLEAASHAFWLAQAENDQKKKGTGTTYDQHVRRYVEFWNKYQAELCLGNSHCFSIPSFPITAAKVAMFLQHKSTREKVSFEAKLDIISSSLMHNSSSQLMPGSQQTVAGSNVGKSSISGAISALEKYRLNHA